MKCESDFARYWRDFGWSWPRCYWMKFWMWLAFGVIRIRFASPILDRKGPTRTYIALRRLANWCEDIGRFNRLGWEIYD